MIRTGPAILGLAWSVAVIAAAPAQSGSPRTELDGAWQARTVEQNGKPAPPETVTRTRYTFKGTLLLVRGNYATDREDEMTVAADASALPKSLDLTDVNGYETLGIYELKDDVLTICLSRAERPAECRAGMPRVTRIVFTRIK